MARRYSDIERGPLLAEAYNNRRQYQQRSIVDRNAARRNRGPSSPLLYVSVNPFGKDLDAGKSYLVRTNQRNHQQMTTILGVRGDVPGPDTNADRNGNFVPAKIKLFVRTGSREATSAITRMRYTQQLGQNYSHPFGRATANEKEYEAATALFSAFRNANPANRVSYSPEKFTGEV